MENEMKDEIEDKTEDEMEDETEDRESMKVSNWVGQSGQGGYGSTKMYILQETAEDSSESIYCLIFKEYDR